MPLSRFKQLVPVTLCLFGVAIARSSPDTSSSNTELSGEVFVVLRANDILRLPGLKVGVYGVFDEGRVAQLKAREEAIMAEDPPDAEPGSRMAFILKRQAAHRAWLEFVQQTLDPLASTYTDSNGQFSLKIKGMKDYTIVVLADRQLGNSDAQHDHRIWIIKSSEVDDPRKIELGPQNETPFGY